MTAPVPPSPEMIVCSTITKQPHPAPAEMPAVSIVEPPWWQGLTPDQQDEALNRIDPEYYGPHQKPPMAPGKWNREKRRVRRLRQRWLAEIAALRRHCHCHNCRRHERPPFPRYYVVRGISYECWLEAHAIDDEIEDLLAPLRNDRPRVGSAFVGRDPNAMEYSNARYRGAALF